MAGDSPKKPPESGEKKPNAQAVARSAAIRSKIQAQIDHAERQRKQDMLRRRLDIAGRGVKQFETGKITEAVQSFETYIRILEEWKGAPEGGLTPEHFDRKADLSELLLISGVFWDLAKVYDHTETPAKVVMFKRYIQKYVLFSRGFPYQALCAETLRKYIGARKCKHKAEFKTAYQTLAISKCFVATSLVDVTEEATLVLLREFRDQVLSKSFGGRAFIAVYYRLGPSAAWICDRLPGPARLGLGRALDKLASALPVQ